MKSHDAKAVIREPADKIEMLGRQPRDYRFLMAREKPDWAGEEPRCEWCQANWMLFPCRPIAPLPFTSRRFVKCMVCETPYLDRSPAHASTERKAPQ